MSKSSTDSLRPEPKTRASARAAAGRGLPDSGIRSAEAFPELAARQLSRAREASTPQARLEAAELGLQIVGDDQTLHVLLLRQRYLAEICMGALEDALESAEEMCALRALHDVAQHDRARVLDALGEVKGAISALRLALRAAPAHRRSFSYFSLALMLFYEEDYEAAASTLRKGMRYAQRDRPLLKALLTLTQLKQEQAEEGFAQAAAQLSAAPSGEGIGRIVLGLLAYEIGDLQMAATHMRAFLRRNARVDPAKELSLQREFRVARAILAQISAD